MSLAPGTRLGPYEALALIGAGGMGEVWKARDTRLERIVALKVSQERFSERVEREARAIAALNHPHVCALYDVGPDYLVMEYLDGKRLSGPLPLKTALQWAIQVADALSAAHAKGVIHRDLKPDNILVTKAAVKLLDFGLAKFSVPASQTDAIEATTATIAGRADSQGGARSRNVCSRISTDALQVGQGSLYPVLHRDLAGAASHPVKRPDDRLEETAWQNALQNR